MTYGQRPPDTSSSELSPSASFPGVEEILFGAPSLRLSPDSACPFEFVSCALVIFNLQFYDCRASHANARDGIRPHDRVSYPYPGCRAIRQMPYFVVDQEANVETPCAAPVVAPWEISAEAQSHRGRVIANLGASAHSLSDHRRTRRPHRMKRLLSRSQTMISPKPLTPLHEDRAF